MSRKKSTGKKGTAKAAEARERGGFKASRHGAGKASAAGSANIFNILAFSSSLPEHLLGIVARHQLAFTIQEWS